MFLIFVLCYADINEYVGETGFIREVSQPEWGVGGYYNGSQQGGAPEGFFWGWKG